MPLLASVRAMACNSLSFLPAFSPTSSLPSISNSDSDKKFRASFARQPVQEDDDEELTSAAKFEENSSITDFLRFKKSEGGSRDLQPAVVSYGKKFPWSLPWPFLQVDLVSTIHIADKEYFSTIQQELELYYCVLYGLHQAADGEDPHARFPARLP